MATTQDLANLLQAQQQTMQAQLAELRGIQRASWRTAMVVGGTAAGTAAPATGGVAGGGVAGIAGGGAGGGSGRPGGGVARSGGFGRQPSLAASAIASHPSAGGAYAAGGAAALALKVSSAAVKHFGELSAVRSDRSIGAVEKEFQAAERNMSFFTLGFGNGWLRSSWNQSGQADFRDAVSTARAETLQYGASAQEMGGTLGREELETFYRARLRKAEAFQKSVRDPVNAIEADIAKTDPRTPSFMDKRRGSIPAEAQEYWWGPVEEFSEATREFKDAVKTLKGK